VDTVTNTWVLLNGGSCLQLQLNILGVGTDGSSLRQRICLVFEFEYVKNSSEI
jgi:hypothetical protein